MRYLPLKQLKNKENNRKICHTFDHNFKNIPLYVTSYVSFKRLLYDGALTWKFSKMVLNPFCNEILHVLFWSYQYVDKHVELKTIIRYEDANYIRIVH